MNSRQKVTTSFKDYATSNNWVWGNGNTFFINQKQNEGSTTSSKETFLFVFDFRGSGSKDGELNLSNDAFVVDFFIGRKSLMGTDYSESNQGVKNSFYRLDQAFEPLFTEFKALLKTIHVCDGLDIANFNWSERVNWCDHNLDGYLVTVNLTVV